MCSPNPKSLEVLKDGTKVIQEIENGQIHDKSKFLYHLPGMNLSVIKANEKQWGPQGQDRSFIESIEYWVRQDDHTWDDVCKALDNSDNKRLANALRKKYLSNDIETDGGSCSDEADSTTPDSDYHYVGLQKPILFQAQGSDCGTPVVYTDDTEADIQIKYTEATNQINEFFVVAKKDVKKVQSQVQEVIDQEIEGSCDNSCRANQRALMNLIHSITALKDQAENYEKTMEKAKEQLEKQNYRPAYQVRRGSLSQGAEDKLQSMDAKLDPINNELRKIEKSIPSTDIPSTPKQVMDEMSTILKVKLQPNDPSTDHDDYIVLPRVVV